MVGESERNGTQFMCSVVDGVIIVRGASMSVECIVGRKIPFAIDTISSFILF
jgi:hypothetical protein